jgi:SAM-dependent methyltransferase
VSDWGQEESRIRAAYRARADRGASAAYTWSSPAYVFEAHERERALLRLLAQARALPLAGRRILDVGCGSGRGLRELLRWGAEPEALAGIDLRDDALSQARRTMAPAVRIECGSAACMPFGDGAFDLVVQATMMSSVLEPELRQRIAGEMLRVLKPGGTIVWYDVCANNPSNRDLRCVGREEIRALFAGCRIRLERIVLAAPVRRRLAHRSWLACYVLGRIPLLCTHYGGTIVKPGIPPS